MSKPKRYRLELDFREMAHLEEFYKDLQRMGLCSTNTRLEIKPNRKAEGVRLEKFHIRDKE